MRPRVEALDALRGFALCGIILVNVTWFSGYAVATPAERAVLSAPAVDEALALALHVLVEGKFYGLFSLMFGTGFALMIDGARARGAPVVPLAARRLLMLLAIGAAHAWLLWFGDIIALYAVAAVPLLWWHRWSARRLVIAATACLMAPVVISAMLLLARVVWGDPSGEELGHGPAELLPVFSSGTYVDLLHANAQFVRERWILALYSSRLVRILGLFVLGMLAVRERPRPTPRTIGALVVSALVANVALAFLGDVPVRPVSALGVMRDAVYAIAIPLGSIAYAAVLWPWLVRRGVIARALARAGRLTLTHYITHSVALSVIFYGWGLGAWGRVGLTGAVVIAVAIVVVQVAISGAWLRRFTHGPAEWLLRRAR
ncbi:DUF418 domain-containing protein [Paraliomyxa miuraensis]|uniref:DUF418 domain-containing protein n=1 Tax=Paraliomyxa miuraensis TaxID=376150 RepID=UPI002253280B|nr:DUF418 domain-containing protein [Paraliomyxa miuraensis]MCX4246547.1 DUF418 domain-containing protein [Paraliomyxa miuraensis]